MPWLLDTNVISELKKSRPDEKLLGWYETTAPTEMFTSSLNIAELVYGAGQVQTKEKRTELLRWINQDIRAFFADRIVQITETILVQWRILARQAELQKTPGPATDLLIAAIALDQKLGVATRDVKPFIALAVPTLNPWTGERFNGA